MAAPRKSKVVFGEWLAMTPLERDRRGLPRSKAGLARQLEVNPKTLRRWETDPVVENAYSAAMADKLPAPLEAAPAAEGEEQPEDDPQSWEDIKARLISGAARSEDGLKLYMQYIGKEELAREVKAAELGFRDLSDDEVINGCLELIGTERVSKWLADHAG